MDTENTLDNSHHSKDIENPSNIFHHSKDSSESTLKEKDIESIVSIVKTVTNSQLDKKLDSFITSISHRFEEASTSKFKQLQEKSHITDVEFKFKGNKEQYLFNSNILDNLSKVSTRLELGRLEETIPIIRSIEKDILHRNKLIKIADRSDGGWETVKEYQKDELASDSDDEKRLRIAESRAKRSRKEKFDRDLKKKKRELFGSSFRESFRFSGDTFRSPHTNNPQFQGFGRQQQLQFGAQQPLGRDICAKCGNTGHWRRECPLNFTPRTSTSIPQASNKGPANIQ